MQPLLYFPTVCSLEMSIKNVLVDICLPVPVWSLLPEPSADLGLWDSAVVESAERCDALIP